MCPRTGTFHLPNGGGFTPVGQLPVLLQGSSPQGLHYPGRQGMPVLQAGKLRLKNVQKLSQGHRDSWLQDFPFFVNIRHPGLQAHRLNPVNQTNPTLPGSAVSRTSWNIVSITSVVILCARMTTRSLL